MIRRLTMIVALLSASAELAVPMVSSANSGTTIILHAVQASVSTCDIVDPCAPSPGQPGIQITQPGTLHEIYLLVRNYQSLQGFQCQLDWPPDWIYISSAWNCQPGCLGSCGLSLPDRNVVLAFNCVTGGSTAVIGYMQFIPGSGCLEVRESTYPFGTHVIGCDNAVTPIDPINWGSVCVDHPGRNTCDTAVPVEGTSWGAIKRQYR